jgi:hypothetical protein
MQAYTARLMPHDSKRDHTMRTFVLGTLRFDAGVWIDVDAPTAAILRAVHQSYYDPFSPPAFEVRAREEQSPAVADASADPIPASAQEEGQSSRKAEKKGRI